jgi:transposase
MKDTQAHTLRLMPTPQQAGIFNNHFEAVRFVFNHYLSEQPYGDYFTQTADLTRLKHRPEMEFLRKVNSQALTHAIRWENTLYSRFRRGKAELVKLGKNDCKFTMNQGVSIRDGKLHIPKVKGGIELYDSVSPIEGRIVECSIELKFGVNYVATILVR